MSIWPHSREGVGLFFWPRKWSAKVGRSQNLNCAGEARVRVAVAPLGLGRDAELSLLTPGLMNVALRDWGVLIARHRVLASAAIGS